MESDLDSLETVQSRQLARERLLAAEIARLRGLEGEVRGKADAAAVWLLRTRLETLADHTVRLESAVRGSDGAETSPAP